MPEGYVDILTRETVSGWAFEPAAIDIKQEISVVVDGLEVGRCVAQALRTNFRHEKLPHQTDVECGFSYRFDPPLSVFRSHSVEIRFVPGGAQVPGGKAEFVCPASFPLPLKPIIVTARGRSGTTLLMKEFLEHPEIAVADAYPYEVKLAAYYASAYRVLTSTKYAVDREPDFVQIAATKMLIGRNPFNEPGLHRLIGTPNLPELFENLIPNKLVSLFREVIVRFYQGIADAKQRSQVRFFAEKGPLDEDLRQGFRMLLGDLREVVLVRDPRDLLCSAKSFWKMNGNDALRTVTESVDALMKVHAEAADDTLIVRYEDLIEHPTETRETIYRFIGASSFAAAASPGVESLRRIHATTSDSRASIGRWRYDLTQGEILACLDHFDDFMRTFGYASASRGDHAKGAHLPAGLRPYHTLDPERPREKLYVNELGRAVGEDLMGAEKALTVFFAAGGNSKDYAATGLSVPEREFRWSSADAVELRIPAPSRRGAYILELFARPFLAPERIAEQTVRVIVNGELLGQVQCRDKLVMRCGVPEAVLQRADPVVVTFKITGAARPVDVLPRSTDNRLLGLAFERLAMFGPIVDPSVLTVASPPEIAPPIKRSVRRKRIG